MTRSTRMAIAAATMAMISSTVAAKDPAWCGEDAIRDGTAAIIARDSAGLEAISRRYLSQCKEADSKDRASALENLAIALDMRGDARGSLRESIKCIETSYRMPGCHVQKAMAHLALSEKSKARVALDIADSVISQQWDLAMASAEKPGADKVLIDAELNKLTSLIQLSARVRKDLQ